MGSTLWTRWGRKVLTADVLRILWSALFSSPLTNPKTLWHAFSVSNGKARMRSRAFFYQTSFDTPAVKSVGRTLPFRLMELMYRPMKLEKFIRRRVF